MAAEAKQAARRAWRYGVTESWGSLAEQCPVGGHIVDWRHMGREHTWHVYDLKPGSPTFGECTGYATGVYLDRGYVKDGRYDVDAPSAAKREHEAEHRCASD